MIYLLNILNWMVIKLNAKGFTYGKRVKTEDMG